MGGLKFHKHLRLVKRSWFKTCYTSGKRYHTRHFIIFVLPNGLDHWRLGITASRKIGPAVLRNRIKRLVRETFRLNQSQVPLNADYVVVTKKRDDLKQLNLDMVQEQILRFFRHIRPRTPDQPDARPLQDYSGY
ncbi:ribonuclease P protein component [Desulfonatronospira sp.]|uniref:ribonuclease P protein component n=1 Tax=Desulfonatronospira sp. TaxID=1962951 RepID=UPI0025B8C185|nr:ribonuclease P protein component [Desulfonatronospira sp.]